MRFLSICSGIEAASVAWHPLAWEPLGFSEIEPFPRAVLAHHYPDVPLHGDFTVLKHEVWIVDADVLVGGTPCQAFSVAGLRNSLSDQRGNLSLEYVRLADAIDDLRSAAGKQPSIIVWENVPGVLSVKDNAFGCFLAGLAGDIDPYVPPRGKWTNAGVVDGPQRTVAWRILDAQYFGLAQRRRRVFVVASARDGFDPAAVLFEFEGVRRDTPPSREAGQIAPTIPSRSTAGGGLGTDFDCDGGVIPSTGDVSHCLNAGGMGRQDYETETLVAHSPRAEGFDASEDGTGRVTPLVPVALTGHGQYAEVPPTLRASGGDCQGGSEALAPVAFHPTQDPISSTDGTTHALACGSKGGQASVAIGFYANEGSHGSGENDELCPTLKAHPKTSNLAAVAIAFSAKDHGADATEDLSPTLRAMPHHQSHANGGGQMAVAVPLSERLKGRPPVECSFADEFGTPVFPLQEVGKRTGASTTDPRAGIGIGEDVDPMFTLQAGARHGVAAYAFQPRIARNGRGDMGDVVNALNAQSGETGKGDAAPCVAVMQPIPIDTMNHIRRGDSHSFGDFEPGAPSYTLTKGHSHAVAAPPSMAVRRLTPVECERLQGFPDNYTAIPWKKKPAEDCPDGPRYKALGNSMAVPVMRWIGRRIAEELEKSTEAAA